MPMPRKPESGAFGWFLRLTFENEDRILAMKVLSLMYLPSGYVLQPLAGRNFLTVFTFYDAADRCELCGVGMTIWNIWASSTIALRAEERGVTCARVKRVPSDARSA